MNRKAFTGFVAVFLTIALMAFIYQVQQERIAKKNPFANFRYESNYQQDIICKNYYKLNNMKAVKVQYTVKPGFAETNALNIKKVMADLNKLNSDKIKYSSFLMSDKVSFVHFLITVDEGSNILNNLESFKKFQAELKASQPETPPKVEKLTLVGSSYDFFNQ